jgi:uncharacterized protein (DUF302 family)
MVSQNATIRYIVRESFTVVVDEVRHALQMNGLRVASLLDISARIERSLGIRLPACKILFVLPAGSEIAIQSGAATFLPLHVVVSTSNGLTTVEVQNRFPREIQDDDGDGLVTVVETQRKLAEALETVAVRASLLA